MKEQRLHDALIDYMDRHNLKRIQVEASKTFGEKDLVISTSEYENYNT